MEYDEARLRQRFDALLGDMFTQEQKDQAFRVFLGWWGGHLYNQGVQDGNEGQRVADPARRAGGYACAHAGGRALEDAGFGRARDHHRAALVDMGQGLDATQRADLLRGAASFGYSHDAVTFAAISFGLLPVNLKNMDSQQQAFYNQLTTIAEANTERYEQEVIRLRERQDDERSRDMYARAFRRLSDYVGADTKANQLLEGDPTIEAAIAGQGARAALDAGDMTVVPSRSRGGSRVA
ncbi:MAG: hypothetical protein AB1324_07660 [Candidatus Micrarchaeota archaeon]